ncbi:MAG: crossover junction endodeoxyribonuclease RuvC, partial [Spirochaetales bacterium]|nr:crossover junction endodeoxyribonuclease RuvC [Spirochaetales bacterium]
MLVLGIDPGIANTGWGVVDFVGQKFRPVCYGVIN